MSEFIFGLTGNIVKVSEIVAISITSNQDETEDSYGVQVLLQNGHVVPIDVYLPSIGVARALIEEMVHAMRFSDTWLYALHNHRTQETPVEHEIEPDSESIEEIVEEEFEEEIEDGDDEFTTF